MESIQSGQGGCRYCGKVTSGEKRRIPEKDAVAIMLKAKLKPMEPYVDSKKRWKCQCMKCGMAVEPSLGGIQQGRGGCISCGRVTTAGKRRRPETEAVQIMINSGYKPLEPYKNNLTPWKSKCLKCGKTVKPRLDSVQSGQGGCRYCAPYGINMENPSYLYLITHVGLGAHKVGIGNHKKRNDRLGRFIKTGWGAHKVWQMKTGAEALKTEKVIFKILRKDMKLPPYLSKEDMPKTDGWSETVDADAITLLQLEKIIKKVIKGLKG